MTLCGADFVRAILLLASSHSARVVAKSVIRYGIIASVDIVKGNAATQDDLRKKYRILCFGIELQG